MLVPITSFSCYKNRYVTNFRHAQISAGKVPFLKRGLSTGVAPRSTREIDAPAQAPGESCDPLETSAAIML
jgi:hypothetical protein